MAPHKFAIGQLVDFDTNSKISMKVNGPFEIVRVLPADDVPARAYRIKSRTEPFERVVKEYELVAVAVAAG